jgi:hypothetical protein
VVDVERGSREDLRMRVRERMVSLLWLFSSLTAGCFALSERPSDGGLADAAFADAEASDAGPPPQICPHGFVRRPVFRVDAGVVSQTTLIPHGDSDFLASTIDRDGEVTWVIHRVLRATGDVEEVTSLPGFGDSLSPPMAWEGGVSFLGVSRIEERAVRVRWTPTGVQVDELEWPEARRLRLLSTSSEGDVLVGVSLGASARLERIEWAVAGEVVVATIEDATISDLGLGAWHGGHVGSATLPSGEHALSILATAGVENAGRVFWLDRNARRATGTLDVRAASSPPHGSLIAMERESVLWIAERSSGAELHLIGRRGSEVRSAELTAVPHRVGSDGDTALFVRSGRGARAPDPGEISHDIEIFVGRFVSDAPLVEGSGVPMMTTDCLATAIAPEAGGVVVALSCERGSRVELAFGCVAGVDG